MSHISRPLEGIRVVELATFIAGPCCARYLADLGAQVIKVESPAGDPLRYTAVNEGRPFGDGEDTSFTLENAGKKVITLNTKTEKGREALEKLIARADVFITNWRQSPLKRAGLDYETLKVKYPALVMGYVSGYGEKGPDKDLPGFDFTAYFARAGIMGTMFDKDSMPLTPVAGFGDHQVGMNLASGVLAALLRAKTTGQGDQVVVSLFHSGVWDISLYLQAAQYGDASTQFPISRKKIANPLNVAHKTADDKWFQFSMPQYDKLYNKFVGEVLEREDLVNDPRFYPQVNLQNNLEEFYAIMAGEVVKQDSQHWAQAMTRADLPFAICQDWGDLLEDKQAWASDILASVKFPNGSERTMVRPPVLFAETDLPPYERGAFLGEHTREILSDIGYEADDIDAMIASGDAADVKRIG